MMINKQFSKCPVCGTDEKYVVFLKDGNEHKEVRVCAKQCMLEKYPKDTDLSDEKKKGKKK